RDGELVLARQLPHERGNDLATIALAKAGRGFCHQLPSGSPQRLQRRCVSPSFRRRCPTRVGLLQRPQIGSTFDRWSDASFSWIPPGCCTPRGFTCRFTMLTRSTSTRFLSARTRRTFPV